MAAASRASGNPRSWIYAFVSAGESIGYFVAWKWHRWTTRRSEVEIATKLLDECTSFGFKRLSKSRHGVKNNYSRVSTVETILQWSEGGEPKSDAIRTVVKKTLDDLYPKLEKMALVLKPLCQPRLPPQRCRQTEPTGRSGQRRRPCNSPTTCSSWSTRSNPRPSSRYVKHVIGIQVDGLPLHGLGFIPQKACVLLQIKLPQSD